MAFTADAVEHSEVAQAGNVLQFVTPKDFMLAMRQEDLSKAVQRVSARPFKIKMTAGDARARDELPQWRRSRSRTKWRSARWRIRKCSGSAKFSAAKCAPSAI